MINIVSHHSLIDSILPKKTLETWDFPCFRAWEDESRLRADPRQRRHPTDADAHGASTQRRNAAKI